MNNSMRVTDHPVLGPTEPKKKITIYFEDRALEAVEGETIAATLTSAGIKAFRTTEKHHEPRGLYCSLGRCSDCMMIVNGEPNVRTCITVVEDGMRVEMQHGLV